MPLYTRFSFTSNSCRCKNEGLGNPKLKVALTYEPQTDLQSTVATDDNDNTLATVKVI